MKLLKQRNFGDIFNDTFGFLKLNGKHFFKNYFLINGIPILISLIFVYFFVSSFYNISTISVGDDTHAMESFVQNNTGLFILLLILGIILAIIFGIIQYTFTPIYLLLYQEKGTQFSSKDIFKQMFKIKLPKILIFFLVSILMLIPTVIVGVIAGFILIFTIIGIFFLFATIMIWYNNALVEYLNSKRGVFSCFGYSFDLLGVNFWGYVGAIGLFLILIQIINYATTLIFTMLGGLIAANTINANEADVIGILVIVISFVVYFLVTMFLQIIIQLAMNLVYFSAKEAKENIATLEEIDKIGLGG